MSRKRHAKTANLSKSFVVYHLDLAEREGFEPTLEFPLNTLSKRAPSATRPSLLNHEKILVKISTGVQAIQFEHSRSLQPAGEPKIPITSTFHLPESPASRV